MKKVVNASVGGRSFAFNEDAYSRLVSYFNHFEAKLGKDALESKNEVMSDLENRLAELFSQATGSIATRVVDLALVNRTVEQLGMPDGSAEPSDAEEYSSPEPEQGGGDGIFKGADFSYSGAKGEQPRHLFRDPDNKAIGGVAAGLAALLNLDISIVRVVLLLAVLLWGSGLLVYIVLWIVVPLAKTPADKCAMRGLAPTAENMARFSTTQK
ncbi:MAG: PspC domain-containing protein [Candidatus Cryptobacteroides sp.]